MRSTFRLLLALVVALGLSASVVATANAAEGEFIKNSPLQQEGNINLRSSSTTTPTVVLQEIPGQTAPVLEVLTSWGYEELSISPFGGLLLHAPIEAYSPIYANGGILAENTVTSQPPFPDSKALNVESPSPANIEVFEVDTEKDAVRLKAHLISGNPTGTTTAVVGAGAGSGASATLSGDDEHGSVTVETGTGTNGSSLASVKFSSTLTNSPYVTLTPGTASAATAKTYVTAVTSSGFTIETTGKPKENTTYVYYYSASQ